MLIVAIVLDVWLKDESALLENYVAKEEIAKNIDITDKSLITNTILNTKEDLLTGRSFKRDLTVPKRENENEFLRRVVYDKFGNELYNDNFHQKIGDFDKLIHAEKDGEIYSQYSGTIQPNKNFNELDPFKEKYDENLKYISRNRFSSAKKSSNSKYSHLNPYRKK